MKVQFEKMHGAGNDFIILDERQSACNLTPRRIAALADRHRGIGCDQLVALTPARMAEADVFVRFFNTDGTEAGACGNASRCVARLLAGQGGKSAITLQTCAGLLHAKVEENGLVRVDMGVPALEWDKIPLAHAMDTLALPWEAAAALSMGNPHVTFFTDDIDTETIRAQGAEVEHHPLFPERVNVGFASTIDSKTLRLRVWERGSGLTLACGSGACAAAVNAMRTGRVTGRSCAVVMDGGRVDITWDTHDHVHMTGPAVHSFSGCVDMDSYPQ